MRKGFKNLRKDMKYTWEHKKAFIKTEKELTGKVTLAGLMHDMDKMFLYILFTKKEVSKLHRSYSKHHTGNHKSEKDIIQALVDWECARLTKPDKQETSREYLYTHIPQHKKMYEPIMEKLGI